MNKHTKGPWRVSQNISRCVIGPSGGVVASAELTWTAQIGEANARLIAAAPDLLAALAEYVNADLVDEELNGRKRMARAAIAKATGEQA